MDILRKELNQIYESQMLGRERLSVGEVDAARSEAELLARVGSGCAVVTDAAADRCYIFGGRLGRVIGFFGGVNETAEMLSSDEDIVYSRIHPEDLVDKRLLEFEFFKFVDAMPPEEKLCYMASCTIRMKDAGGVYRHVDNTTRIHRLSPDGKMWLILCTYAISDRQPIGYGIAPAIVDTMTGEVTRLDFGPSRNKILSPREKEILRLIRDGMPSKLIADRLDISVNTVNRHRQNIISKLCVGNSFEAISAATVMKLL